jgi:hypothetical protein
LTSPQWAHRELLHGGPNQACDDTDQPRISGRTTTTENQSNVVNHLPTICNRPRTRLLYLANAMVDQHIELEETDDGIWAIHFNTVLLATFDERDYIITG